MAKVDSFAQETWNFLGGAYLSRRYPSTFSNRDYSTHRGKSGPEKLPQILGGMGTTIGAT